MHKTKLVRLGVTATGMALALTVFAAMPAVASKTVKTPTTLQISAYGYFGTVKSPNSGCIEDRKIVLKQKGYGVLGRDTSDEQGRWKVDSEELNKNFKGPLPYKIYAYAKPLSQGAAGTIYKCDAATSKTIEIAGG